MYRDDGISVMSGNGHDKDQKRKAIIRIFKQQGFNITWEVNVKKVQFLDVMLDLENNCYKPYHKLNSQIMYVANGSNHPRVVLNNIPEGINKRLS